MKLTAITEREDNGHVALYPQLDVTSQGDTVEQAVENLREALWLFFGTASKQEIEGRIKKRFS